MKYVKQLCIILLISFAGEVLHVMLPFSIPASIYGIILLFCLLEFKILPLKAVKETGDFLVSIMQLMFIPAAVGLMDQFQSLRAILLPYLVINLVGLVVTFAVTGRVTQFFLRREKGAKK